MINSWQFVLFSKEYMLSTHKLLCLPLHLVQESPKSTSSRFDPGSLGTVPQLFCNRASRDELQLLPVKGHDRKLTVHLLHVIVSSPPWCRRPFFFKTGDHQSAYFMFFCCLLPSMCYKLPTVACIHAMCL